MKLISPPRPKKGDKAIIVSPSAGLMPFAKKRVLRAKENLKNIGLIVEFSKHAKENEGYVSSSIDNRVSDLHDAFADKNCSLIMASIGGNHSNQLLAHLDFKLIKDNPKVFIGYSDNTVLHFALFTQANLQSYYGPCFLTQFGEYPEVFDFTIGHFKDVVLKKNNTLDIVPSEAHTDEILDWFTGEDSKRRRKLTKNKGYEWWNKGKASGWCLPFAIPSINHLLGSIYMPSSRGAVAMIDIPEGKTIFEGLSIDEFDSYFTDLINIGFFDEVKALCVGRAYHYSEEDISTVKDIVLERFRNVGIEIPTVYGLDFGHTDPLITLPLGASIRLDSDKDQIQLINEVSTQ